MSVSNCNSSLLVSVVLPVYNGQKHLREAIDSIMSQTFKEFELLIINDASVDESEKIILSYDDRRISYIKNESNLGLVGALNKGLSLAKGKYVARMDQDDISLPDRLSRQLEFMEINPDYIVCGTQVEVFEGPGNLKYSLTDEECRIELLFAPAFSHPTVMMRSSVLKNNDLFYRENYKDAEDYGLWVEISPFGKMANLPLTGLLYRRHPGQYTNMFKDGMFNVSGVIRKNYLDSLGIRLEEKDQFIFDIISQRRINYGDFELINAIGDFLGRFPDILKDSGLKRELLQKKMYLFWRRICGEYEKCGKSAYRLFHSSPAANWGFDIKQRLSLLKNLFLLRN